MNNPTTQPNNYTQPLVSERVGNSDRLMDVYTRLLKDGIIFYGYEVTSQTANDVVAQLLYLQQEGRKEITMYINTPGGSVTSGMAVYDTMQMLNAMGITIKTYAVGMAASMGSLLLAGGTKGHRHALPNSRIMIHQPLGGAQGQQTEILINAKEITRWRKVLTEILAAHSGQSYKKVFRDTERDNYMTAAQALKYGLIDHIVTAPGVAVPATA